MSTPECIRPAPFCRLCLTETKDKVSIFGEDETNILNLLTLIELDIDLDNEPEACVCFDCIVTLEGFFQFKEQCHVNDEFIKSVPPEKVDDDDDDGSDDDDEPAVLPTSYDSSEEEGLVKDFDEIPTAPSKSTTVSSDGGRSKPEVKPRIKATYAPEELEKVVQDFSFSELDKVQVLQDSYPDYFHFERGKRSTYYTLVYYGERYNSPVFNDTYTYWQCANRRRFQCPARVYVTHDYTDFERQFEHTHGEVIDTEENDLFTPKQALPQVFKLCKEYIIRRKAKGRRVVLKRREAAEAKKKRVQIPEEVIIEEQVYDNESLIRVLNEGGEVEGERAIIAEYYVGDSSSSS